MAVVVAACAVTSGVAVAGDWEFTPRLGSQVEAYVNPRLGSTGTPDSYLVAIDVSLPGAYRTETGEVRLTLGGRAPQVRGDDSLGGNSGQATLDWRQFGETWQLDASAQLREQVVLADDPDDLGGGDLGLRRRSLLAHFGSSLQAGALARLGWRASWQRNDYRGDASTAYDSADHDFTTLNVYGDLQRSQRSSLRLVAGVTRLQPSGAGTDFDEVSASLRASHLLGPRWSLVAGIGRSETSGGGGRGALYDLALRRQSERGSLTLSASQSVTPVSSGVLARNTVWRLDAERAVSARARLAAGVARIETEEFRGSLRAPLRRYLRGEVRADWRLTPQWTAGLRWWLAEREFDAATGTGSALLLSLGYSLRPQEAT